MNVLASKHQLRTSLIRWLLFTVPTVLLIGFLFSKLGDPGTAWFAGLNKPAIFPPFIVFPLVWNTLFIMIGVALALVGSAWGAPGRGLALVAFAIHFLGTQAWTLVFFGLHDMFAGLMVLGYGIASLLIALALIARVRRLAALLLLPYLAWLCFAGVLNYQFITANPDGGPAIDDGAMTRVDL